MTDRPPVGRVPTGPTDCGPVDGGPAPVFAALADPTRRIILRTVADRGEATATELAANLPVSRQAVVKHLQALAGAGLVESAKHGREQRFRLTLDPLDQAVGWMAAVGAAWDARLERLRHQVEGS